jgi:superfamily II DNA or RNA helicase/DNA-directed RNA polymerase subunit M/transcription elongation factor TFIIS
MEKTQFDKSQILDYVIKSLRNKSLLPKPHLGVLETKFPESNSAGLFTFSDRPVSQNIIGYDFLIKEQGENPSLKTTFTFFVRAGDIKSSEESTEEDFIPITCIIELNPKTLITNILIKNGKTDEEYKNESLVKYREVGSKSFFKSNWNQNFNVKYKVFGKQDFKEKANNININFFKNIKKEGGGTYRIQLRIVNENEKGSEITSLNKVGVIKGEHESYQNIPLGLLLDFKISEECLQAKFDIKENRWGIETSIKRLFNLVPQEETAGVINFSEYYRGYESIPRFKEGSSKEDFISMAKEQGVTIHKDVADSYSHINSFYKYQEEGIVKIAKELNEKKGIVNIISVRTAGGKTETFAVPLINYCYENIDKIGTKSLIFYPTKALANDQAARIFKSLYGINKKLKSLGKRPIMMGLYHGDIKKTSREEKELWVPFKCPNCNSQITFKTNGIQNEVICSSCGEDLSYLILTRYEIHKKTPDIVVTNQDTLHYTLMNFPENHSIFGRDIKYCEECGESFINKRSCSACHKPLTKIEPQCSPEILVLDEIHMLGGAFGINTSMFLKRLINLIKSYSKNGEYKPTFIGATATIKHPEEFASQLFDSKNISKIPLDEKTAYKTEVSKEEKVQREHLFILPRSYDSSDTLSYGVHYILKYFAQNFEDKPAILGFCESIKDNRNLIKLTNSRKPDIEGKSFLIGGHTSQFERDLRADIEKKFTRKEIDILYATSTLEVGVDFDDINVLLLHGVPYSFNDYLQRVGRSGRKKDAAVITTLRKWSSLDYFYLEKCKAMLSNPRKFIVDPPFNENNEVILKNHIRALFFDYLSSRPDTETISTIIDLRNFLSGGDAKKGFSQEFKNQFINYCKSCFGNLIKTESVIVDTLEDSNMGLQKFIFAEGIVKNVKELFEEVNKEFQIGKLRSADKVVEVEFQI